MIPLQHFRANILAVPTVWIDTETTGLNPAVDRVVQLGVARLEPGGEQCASLSVLVNPQRSIPAEATAVHGITEEMVADAASIKDALQVVETLIDGAVPGAYNAHFDRSFLPTLASPDWPWVDGLTVVRHVDRYTRGKGRHKLETACQRHGINLPAAHDAAADAEAAGRLFFQLLSHERMSEAPRGVGALL